jgi:hypothetical protein
MNNKLTIAALAVMLASTAPAIADQADYDLVMTITLDFFNVGDFGSLARELGDDRDDYAAAKKFVRFCTDTPAAKMSRIALQTCTTFDDWFKAYRTYGRDAVLAMQCTTGKSVGKTCRDWAEKLDAEKAQKAEKAAKEVASRREAEAEAARKRASDLPQKDWRPAKPANDWKVYR